MGSGWRTSATEIPWYEHFQGGKLMQTPGPDRAVEMPVHLEILEPNSETSTNSVDERLEPLQTGGRSAGSILATALGAEVRKRKANRAKQDSSSNFLISKRPRPSTLGLHSITGASLGSEEVQERRVDMISDRVCLLEQISRMNDEMRISEAWTTEAMEESRKKDKEILELQKVLGSGQLISRRKSDSPSVVISPGSLACKSAQPNSIGTDQVKFEILRII